MYTKFVIIMCGFPLLNISKYFLVTYLGCAQLFDEIKASNKSWELIFQPLMQIIIQSFIVE